MFGGILDIFTGGSQGASGQQNLPAFSQMSGQGYLDKMADYYPRAANINTGYSNLMESGYDPNQRPLRESTSASLLNELNLGGALDPDTINMMRQNSRQTGAAVGPGQFTRNLVPRDLGLMAEQIKRQRQQDAAAYTLATPKGWQMTSAVNPADAAGLDVANINAGNAYNQFASQLAAQNAANASSTDMGIFGNLLGGLGGAMQNIDFGSILGGGGTVNKGTGGRPDSIVASPAGGDWLSGLLGMAGGALGGMYGGPVGGMLGSKIGGSAPGMFSQMFKFK